MKKNYKWYEHFAINAYWLGQSMVSQVFSTLLPVLILLFVTENQKNTYLSFLRVAGLLVAMLINPIAGLFSDRSTIRWGRRRPYIVVGAVLNALCVILVGLSPKFGILTPEMQLVASGAAFGFSVLMFAILLSQFSANIAQGALQALMPDIVPEKERGISSAIKSILEVPLPGIAAIGIGFMIDKGMHFESALVVAIILLITMLITVLTAKEVPLAEKPKDNVTEPILRFFGLTAIFLAFYGAAYFLIIGAKKLVQPWPLPAQIAVIGLIGLVATTLAIVFGASLSAQVGVGKEARKQSGFIWWVVNRLMFLVAVGAIRTFALYFLRDVIKVSNPSIYNSILLGVIALFIIPASIIGGKMSDKFGRKRPLIVAGWIGLGGTLLLILSGYLANYDLLHVPQIVYIVLVILSGCIIGAAAGIFFATNWALGTDLVPQAQAGKFLGISNIAGAGAGIMGEGLSGPIADFFNTIQAGLGYLVIFSIYALLFLFSIFILGRIPLKTDKAK